MGSWLRPFLGLMIAVSFCIPAMPQGVEAAQEQAPQEEPVAPDETEEQPQVERESTTDFGRLTPAEARRRLESARAAQAEPTIGELKQRVFSREVEIRRLQQQMLELEDELERLRIENGALKMALDTIRNTPIQITANGERINEMPEPEPVVDEPRWTVQYSLGIIETGGTRRGGVTGLSTIRMIRPSTLGVVFIRDRPSVDRRNVIIRGNFKNESLMSYRYTFEIRIGGRADNRIIGSWRYQTPELAAGEIHQFEVKVPVSHVAEVSTYEIGNVVADREEGLPLPPAEGDADADDDVENVGQRRQPRQVVPGEQNVNARAVSLKPQAPESR